MLLDATKPQDGVNGNAEGVHSAEGADSGRATGSEVIAELISTFFSNYVEDIVPDIWYSPNVILYFIRKHFLLAQFNKSPARILFAI